MAPKRSVSAPVNNTPQSGRISNAGKRADQRRVNADIRCGNRGDDRDTEHRHGRHGLHGEGRSQRWQRRSDRLRITSHIKNTARRENRGILVTVLFRRERLDGFPKGIGVNWFWNISGSGGVSSNTTSLPLRNNFIISYTHIALLFQIYVEYVT